MGKFVVRSSISQLEQRLPGEDFVRIHRSFIVNLDLIVSLSQSNHGECEVVLRDGTRLTLSRSFRERLLRRFEQL